MSKVGNRYDLVILGIGTDGKPHAAAFPAADEPTVRKAADAMAMQVGVAATDEARRLAKKLPFGKLFATGKALVPLVKQALYEQLTKTLSDLGTGKTPGCDETQTAETGDSSDEHVATWDDIKVGSVVLCRDDSDEPAWWKVVVLAIGPDGGSLIVRWCDYPKLKSFAAKRHAVALIGPAVTGGPKAARRA